MNPVQFPESNCTFAADQPEYLPLPVYKSESGDVISCWKFSLWERLKVLFTGKMWLYMLTFNQPLQPQRPMIKCPFNETEEVREKKRKCKRIGCLSAILICGVCALGEGIIGNWGWMAFDIVGVLIWVSLSFEHKPKKGSKQPGVLV